MAEQIWLVFDVESVGLHGEAFAVGAQVIELDGFVHEEYLFACDPAEAAGSDEGRAWVAEHCPFIPRNCATPRGVRQQFWREWQRWKERGALLVADCGWPVEARFLIACVDDEPDERSWQGPYPFHDLASLMLVAGFNPLATYERRDDEVEHDPLGDARQSARLLVQVLGFMRAQAERAAGRA